MVHVLVLECAGLKIGRGGGMVQLADVEIDIEMGRVGGRRGQGDGATC